MRLRSWLLLLSLAWVTGCPRRPAETFVEPPPTSQEVWQAIQLRAARYRIDPAFVYTLVAAESNFDPTARRGDARGLLQLTPGAWKAVSDAPYEPTVWRWRASLDAGIDYLAHLRSRLYAQGHTSNALLAASYHYGPEYVADRGFELARIPCPDNPHFRAIWSGRVVPPAGP